MTTTADQTTEPVRYQTYRRDQKPIDRVGVLTGAPGLLLDTALDNCRNDSPCWVIAHQSSGLIFPWCWDNSEDALTFTDKVNILGDWHKDSVWVRSILLNSRPLVLEYAQATYGSPHVGISEAPEGWRP